MEKVLNTIANLQRLKILVCLNRSSKNVSQLIQNCELSQSALSQHLKKLKDANLVVSKKSGREQLYTLTNPEIGKAAEDLFNLLNNLYDKH